MHVGKGSPDVSQARNRLALLKIKKKKVEKSSPSSSYQSHAHSPVHDRNGTHVNQVGGGIARYGGSIETVGSSSVSRKPMRLKGHPSRSPLERRRERRYVASVTR